MIIAASDDTFGEAGWLVSFLARLANALQCECVLSSRDVSQLHESLDVPQFLRQVKSGDVFKLTCPAIVIVRDDLVSASEMSDLVASQPDSKFRTMHYGSHHVLWSMHWDVGSRQHTS